MRFVSRVHVPIAVLPGELLGVFAGVIEVAAVEDDIGAERPHRSDLDRIGASRHANDRLRPEEFGRVRDGLAVVSSRRGDQPGAQLVLGQL